MLNTVSYKFSGKRKYFFLLVFLVASTLFFSSSVVAQDTPQPDTIQIDSAKAIRMGLFNKENKKTFKVLFSGKPGRAALFSFIVPGAGQVYNKNYWKASIVVGVMGFLGYQAITASKKYSEINNSYECMLRGEGCSYKGITSHSILRPIRDKARTNAESAWVFFAVGHLVQTFWAYVDRHFIDFNMDKNLTLKPIISNYSYSLGLSYKINPEKNKKEKKESSWFL